MKSRTITFLTIRTLASDFVELAKPRLNALVIATTAVGYYMGTDNNINVLTFIHTLIGTALVAGGASAINQVLERDVDTLMQRTKLRPIPCGRLRPAEGMGFGLILSMLGLFQLAFGANILSSALALATLVAYISVYTPLKRLSSSATIIGAVPGAFPPVIGWVAARGTLTAEAVTLFAIVFLWQVPHFFAVAWIWREDFKKAGFLFLPVIDDSGQRTARQIILFSIALFPVSLTPTLMGFTGNTYLAGASFLSSSFIIIAFRFAMDRTSRRARSLFLGSLAYLPLLWGLMIAERAL